MEQNNLRKIDLQDNYSNIINNNKRFPSFAYTTHKMTLSQISYGIDHEEGEEGGAFFIE